MVGGSCLQHKIAAAQASVLQQALQQQLLQVLLHDLRHLQQA
jgi:hypothetical protein